MSTISITFSGDFDPASNQSVDLTPYCPTGDAVSIFFQQVGTTPDTLVFGDATTGTYNAFADADGNGTVSEHNAGFQADFSDNTAGCDFLGGDYGDVLIGGTGGDNLTGGGGRDKLTGGGGADRLVSAGDGDTLNGGSGVDTYVFTAMTIHRAATFTNFVGDTLDLSLVDADVTHAGDQAFALVSHFDGHAGELQVKYNHHTGRTELRMDTDGNGQANHIITVVTGNDFSHIIY